MSFDQSPPRIPINSPTNHHQVNLDSLISLQQKLSNLIAYTNEKLKKT